MLKFSLLGLLLVSTTSWVLARVENEENSVAPKLWAVLVAGSNEWYNYRHQADLCHAYQVLHKHGIPDERITVLMYDDLATSSDNPTPGQVINHPNGADVYRGVPKDYVGETVTSETFMKVLKGDKPGLVGVGTGKVLESGPNDHVFINFVDHGGPGILAFPNDELTSQQLMDTLTFMFEHKKYAKMVLYIEACESGSMFKHILPQNMNIYVTTAADYNESSYACYFDDARQTYLGDVYSVNWMEDSDKENIETESLFFQFNLTKEETNTSHVQEYGDLSISKMAVGEFQGEKAAISKKYSKVPYDAVPSRDVPMILLHKKLQKATTPAAKAAIRRKLRMMAAKRELVDSVVAHLVRIVSNGLNQKTRLMERQRPLQNLRCHHRLVKAFSKYCFSFSKNPYALQYAYVLVNMCEEGLSPRRIINSMINICPEEKLVGIN